MCFSCEVCFCGKCVLRGSVLYGRVFYVRCDFVMECFLCWRNIFVGEWEVLWERAFWCDEFLERESLVWKSSW